jgi:hypothetical protein
MKTTIFTRLLTGIFVTGLLLSACSKSDTVNGVNNNGNGSGNQDTGMHASTGILNRNLAIIYAKDGASDITSQFTDLTFKFIGNYPGGQALAWNQSETQTGNWSGTEVTANFAISFPTASFAQLVFLNRPWTMGESSSSAVRLIGADGDELHFGTR